jgi:glycosyltransferase involved in cell wall biosynthesis
MTTPLLSFVIPVRDDAERLRRCLDSIAAQRTDAPVEIIVADNGSADASADVARAAGATVLVLPGLAVAQLRNRAAAAARGDLLAFVDADHELADGWIAEAFARLRDPHVSAAGAEYDAPAGGTWVQRMYDRLRVHRPGVIAVDWLPSGNLVVRRETFLAIGGFDEQLESCEDVDLCRRIREHGGSLISADGLRSTHVGDPKTLTSLFVSELWRGRDNITVSLRERLTWRSAPSVVMPIVNLAAMVVMIAGLALAPWRLGVVALAGAMVVIATSALRAVRLMQRAPAGTPRLVDTAQAVAVAVTYETARALALIAKAGHGIRRKA